MQASGCIHNNVIGFARTCGLQSVVEHGSRIASGLGANHLSPRAVAPDFQLFDGSGAKRVRRAQQNRFAPRAEYLGQFADGRGLARTIHAHHQNNLGALNLTHRLAVRALQNRQQLLFQQPLEFVHILDLFAVGFFAQFFQHFMRGGRA